MINNLFKYICRLVINSDLNPDFALQKNTHFIALRTGFSNIKLSDQFFMGFNPQVYFLKMDKNHGYYFNTTLTIAKRNFPISFATLFSKTIHTEIPVGEDILWNVSLIYTFNKKYIKQ